MANFTFKTDDGLYDVEKLSDTAKSAFNYLAEVQAETQTLSKRIDVLQAAAKTYTAIMLENLNDEALINEEEVDQSDED